MFFYISIMIVKSPNWNVNSVIGVGEAGKEVIVKSPNWNVNDI